MNRKHVSQMSANEVANLNRIVNHANVSRLSQHACQRLIEKRVQQTEVFETVQTGKLIEIHRNVPNDVRVLVRKDYATYSVCVVLSLVSFDVITAYKNSANDYHVTLDWNQYRLREDFSTFQA